MDINAIEKLLEEYRDVKYETIFTNRDMRLRYAEYIKEIQGRKAMTGIPSFDTALGGIRPGQLIAIVGGTNVGKTALAMHTTRQNSKLLNTHLAVLFSLETSETELYERTLQSEFDLTTFDIEKAFIDNDPIIEKFKTIEDKYSNIISIVKRVHVDEIIPYIYAIEKLYSRSVGLIALDWAGLIENWAFKDDTQRMADNMKKIEGFAVSSKKPFYVFHQAPRYDLKERKELGLYSGKGSGEIENTAKVFITIDRIEDPAQIQNEDKTPINLEPDLMAQLGKDKEYALLKATLHKKKQGKWCKPAYLLLNNRTLKITELDLEHNSKIF